MRCYICDKILTEVFIDDRHQVQPCNTCDDAANNLWDHEEDDDNLWLDDGEADSLDSPDFSLDVDV